LSGAVAKPASINLWKLVLSPTSLINLGFILREDLLLCLSYLPLGVPNWVPNKHYQTIFLAPLLGIEEEEAPTSTTRHQRIFLVPLLGRKKISARGVSRFQSFTLLLFCFTLFLLASFYQKYKKN
jgi:hypothetical protein